ncbi:MAG TPA: hypothetical protein VJ755_08685 [Gemmatimonadales bacterium]|nr:hypothetical protein [Gemmatimonadales bacterium]
MNPAEVAVIFFIFGGGFYVLRPVVSAVAKRIAGEHRRPGIEPTERDEIVDELRQVRDELTELAERMDFAERMLAKQGEGGRLSP